MTDVLAVTVQAAQPFTIVQSNLGDRGPAGPGLPDLAFVLASSPDLLVVGAVHRDLTTGLVTTADVRWPDGETGTFTATTYSTDFPGSLDAYTVTKGSATYTQPAVTRDAFGSVSFRPQITVS